MKFQRFIDPGGWQHPPAFAPGVAVRASMEIFMPFTELESQFEQFSEWNFAIEELAKVDILRAAAIKGAKIVMEEIHTASYLSNLFFENGKLKLSVALWYDCYLDFDFDIIDLISGVTDQELPKSDREALANLFDEASKALRLPQPHDESLK